MEVLHANTLALEHVLYVVSLGANDHVEGIAAPAVVTFVAHYVCGLQLSSSVELIDDAIDVVVLLSDDYTWTVFAACAEAVCT